MKLNLEVFEGPLDLLLYLIKKNNLEISRVSLAEVTGQYLLYLETMKELNIDVASDFLLMAAELAHYKSRALLPKDPFAEAEDEDLDDADRLIAKLRIYQMYKEAADKLAGRNLLGRDVFKRGSFQEKFDEGIDQPEEPKEEKYKVELFDLMRAFADVLKRLPKDERKHHVEAERVSVTDRMYEILHSMDEDDSILFADLFTDQNTKIDVVVSFLALLEMVRLKLAHVFQSESMGAIRVQKRIDTNNTFSRRDVEKSEAETYVG